MDHGRRGGRDLTARYVQVTVQLTLLARFKLLFYRSLRVILEKQPHGRIKVVGVGLGAGDGGRRQRHT